MADDTALADALTRYEALEAARRRLASELAPVARMRAVIAENAAGHAIRQHALSDVPALVAEVVRLRQQLDPACVAPETARASASTRASD
jgi:hypothetical protein